MDKQWQKKLLYGLMVVGLIWMYASYVPFLMDYYTCRPDTPFFSFFQENILNVIVEFESVLIVFAIAFIFCLTWNSAVSVGIVSLLLLVLTHASYIKYVNRQELLRLADFKLTEAAGMAAGYLEIEWNSYLAAFAGGLLLFVAAAVGIELIKRKLLFPVDQTVDRSGGEKRKKLIFRVGGIGASVLIGVVGSVYTNQFILSRMDVENADELNLVDGETDRHVLYYLLKNDTLDNISVERAEESYEFLLSKAASRQVTTDVKPNVIVIMNESWWNTDNIATNDVVFSKDPMEPYKRLADECVTGYLSCNVYGGGTVSSEAEFLTGINTKYYLSSSAIYSETMDRKLPSVVDYFNALDYETVAIHPYYGDFYSRKQVYTTMGFDEMVFDEDMQNRDIYTRYISDESLAKEIIAEYEEGGEEQKFIWSVSISNHRNTLEYHLDEVDDYDYPISVDLKSGNLKQSDMDVFTNYINGIYLAGEAYADLIEYFSEKDEPVVVVMYGDHMPNFAVDMLNVMGLTKEKEPGKFDMTHMEDADRVLTAEQKEVADSMDMLNRVYTVPVIMWSNFELEQTPEFDGESIYYLAEMILESAGLPDSEMSRMLRSQRTVFKANSRKYVLNADGERIERCSEAELEMMNHGKVIGYDIMFGEEPRENIWIPIAENE